MWIFSFIIVLPFKIIIKKWSTDRNDSNKWIDMGIIDAKISPFKTVINMKNEKFILFE